MIIRINLLPEHLRPRKEKGVRTPISQILPLALIWLGGLVFLNVLMFVVILILNFNIKMLNGKLAHFKPDIQKTQQLELQLKQSQEKIQVVKQLIDERILWAQKLQILAQNLPKGIWLSSLNINERNINIEGNCVSLKGDEMNLIGGFVTTLKNNKDFFVDFKKLELGPVNRRLIGSIEVVNFMFFGDLNEKH